MKRADLAHEIEIHRFGRLRTGDGIFDAIVRPLLGHNTNPMRGADVDEQIAVYFFGSDSDGMSGDGD